MTPKEKAKELFNKFCYAIRTEETDSGYFTNVLYAKNCALIAIDEVLKAPFEGVYTELIPNDAPDTDWYWDKFIEYWEQVKHEIEKL